MCCESMAYVIICVVYGALDSVSLYNWGFFKGASPLVFISPLDLNFKNMSATKQVKNPYENTYKSGAGSISGSGGVPVMGSGIFGQWTKEDQALFNLQMANAEWQANLSLMDYQNMYNSPAEQVKRMREAGLNPDLLGVGDGGVSAAGAPAPNVSAPDGVSDIDTLGGVFSAFSTAMSVANGLMSFKSAQESLDSQILDNVNKVDGFATSFLVDNLFPESFSEDKKLLQDSRINLISSARAFAQKHYGFSKRQSRRFQDAVVRKMDSPDFLEQFYDTINKSENARQDYLSKTTGDLYSQADETMRILLDEVIKEQNRFYRSSNRLGYIKNRYEGGVYSRLNPRSFADRENNYNIYEAANIRRDIYGKSFFYGFNKGLYNSFKNGNIVSGLTLALGSMARSSGNFLGSVVGKLK